jgi:uncharacterized iron-regulated membrane protein
MATHTELYGAVWRWHFYAGLLTLPFLVLLAVTGGVYLFKDEIANLAYARFVAVEPGAAASLRASAIVAAAEAAVGGTATGYLPPAVPDRAARVFVASTGGARDVFVDPRTGATLGDLAQGDYADLPLLHLVRRIHSLAIAGWPGNRLIEIVAGWALVLVVTGVYLWWPRGQGGGVVSVRRQAGRRVFWRDLHAVTGAFAGALVFFLAATGLPWSGFWGEHFKSAMNDAGLGYPAGFWSPVAESSPTLAELVTPTPWAMTNAPVPESVPPSADGAAVPRPIGVDRAVALLESRGIPAGYTLSFPVGPRGVYSAAVIPDRVGDSRVIHLDQYSGTVLYDARFEDLGAVARLIELGTSLHTGQQLGRVNQLVMLAACIAIVLMAVAAVAMWWRRRPRGALGAPPLPRDFRVPVTLLALIAGFGLLFPMLGLSLLAALAVELALPGRWRKALA